MVLNIETIKQIEDFIRQMPRTVDEVAKSLGVSWRTADRYIGEIVASKGTIAVRVFRGGTRGALKIVYWTATEIPPFTYLQDELWKKIEAGRTKDDFFPLEVYQYVDEKKRKGYGKKKTKKFFYSDRHINDLFMSAEKQILFFSGNATFINYIEDGKKVMNTIEKVAKKGVEIKVICKVGVAGLENIEKLLSINKAVGKEMIEVRHILQPIRGYIIDNKICKLKEVLRPDPKRDEILKEEIMMDYEIYDADWIDWLKKVWWKLYQKGVPVTRRLETLKSIKGIMF